jgi:PhnB protein
MSFKPDYRPQLSVYFTVRDAEKAIDFYKNAFGFEEIEVSKDASGSIQHVEMKKGEALIMFSPEGAFGCLDKKAPITLGIGMPMNLYIYCEDTDALYRTALEHSAKIITEPHDAFWGDRFCSIIDPDGYEWGFCTFLGTKDK